MSYYKQNLECLADEKKILLENHNEKRDLKLIRARNGDYTIKIAIEKGREIFLHSSYNPVIEAKRFINNQNLSGVTNIILVGFGLGYHVEEIFSKLKAEQQLYVIVPNIDLFKIALKIRDLKEILQDKRVKLIIEIDTHSFFSKINPLFNNLSPQDTTLVVHSQSLKVTPDEFIFLKDILEEIKVSSYNSERLGKAIKNNLLKNILNINKTLGVNRFTGIFSKVPVFIISAGPSLDKNIDYLKLIGDRGILIAVDTSIDPLIKKGITPDFIVSIEPIKIVFDKVFRKYDNPGIPLLITLGVNWRVVQYYKGPKILGLAKDDQIMDRLSEQINTGRVLTGGTVSLTALDFAHIIGGDPIIFVGQDFAYSKEGLTHASGTFYGNKRKDVAGLRKVKGVSDDFVYTSTSYYLYLRKTERYIDEYDGIEYIDATEGGARIKGTGIMPLKDTIKKHCRSSLNKRERIGQIIQKERNNITEKSLRKIKDILKEELT